MVKNYRDASRENFVRSDGKEPANEQLQLGCLQRIADAAELTAKNYLQLQKDLDWYKKRYREHLDEIKNLQNSKRGLKGHITRLKCTLDAK